MLSTWYIWEICNLLFVVKQRYKNLPFYIFSISLDDFKEYRIDDDGTVHVVCYLGFSKVVLKGITKVYFDPQRKALRIIAEKSDRWYPLQEPELFVDTLYEYYPDMEYENWS